MNRTSREVSRLVAVLLASGVFAACTSNAASSERPLNVVFFLVDDLGWTDLGCYGSDYYRTPNIDKLAAAGMRFTQNYSACNACSPTRGALMTGMSPARTHLTDWIPGWSKQYGAFRLLPPKWTQHLEQHHTSLAEALRAAGYTTLHVGKWHLGGPGNLPEDHGFDINIGGSIRGAPRSYHFPYGGEAMKWHSSLPESQREGRYLTDRLADEAVELIERTKDKPFFLYFSFYAVHAPVQGRPDLVQTCRQRPAGERHKNSEYAAMVEAVDEAVGRVWTQLARSGVADRTLIVFTSDNGGVCRSTSNNAPLRGQKGQHWEGGTRVPAIVHWPGVTRPNAVCAEPVITMDYYPTILEITGASGNAAHNADVDGVSLVPLLRDPTASLGREALYWHYPHYNPFVGIPYGAVRAGAYKLIEYYEDDRIELYNLADDPSEQCDLAAAHPEVAARLKKLLHDYRDRTKAQMPVPNSGFQAVK
jgi:arylsulfatase A-like enzyme